MNAARDSDDVNALAATVATAGSEQTELASAPRRVGAELVPTQTLAAGRFRILREIGAGGMGRVYEAYDEAYGSAIALKTLRAATAGLLLGLKNEFRALSGVMHPNLVELYELICDDDQWFMTMELVQGCNFEAWLEQRRAAREQGDRAYERELRAVLLQVAHGVSALHAAGKLHRDLKPSNIMITDQGRAVILDFGLATEVRAAFAADEQGVVVGTPSYFAPEQAAGEAATEASDWYAVGVILYKALSGRLPFGGAAMRVIYLKLTDVAPDVAASAPHAPDDLRELCNRLLVRESTQRAGAAQAIAAFADAQQDLRSWPATAPLEAAQSQDLTGRDAELSQLHEAFHAAARGSVTGVWVHGPSGIGKSTLIGHFLQQLEADTEALVLRGRCYERESVPYKACDAMMDALSRKLVSWPQERTAALVPQAPRALTRLFPVLERVPWLALAAERDAQLPNDRQALRRRGFLALRELLHRIAEHVPLVLYIDDLQWGDLDSAKLLAGLLLAPAPRAGLLFVGSFRSDERDSGELLPALAADEELSQQFVPREITLGRLSAAEALRVAERVLGSDPELAAKVAREADGNPFFIGELARHLGEQPDRSSDAFSGSALAHLIEQRVARLPDDARALLEVVAVSGRPVESRIALLASNQRATDRRALVRLEAARLLRARRSDAGELLETYHDRVRQTVVQALPAPQRRSVHRTIALTLEQGGVLDSERLAVHFRDGDEPAKAAQYGELAGDDAYRALAFERAATWYTLALEGAAPSDLRRLHRRLGDALTYAGRGAPAARHYLAAAPGAERGEALELERLAAEQLLISGHRSEGLATLTRVLAASDVSGPNRGPALARLLWQRLRLRVRGTEFARRPEAEIAAQRLRRVDACGVAARTLVVREPVKGAIFGAMHLRLALDAGEPVRVVEGLATEIMYAATEGLSAAARVDRLIARARSIELPGDVPAAEAYLHTAIGGQALLFGRFAQAAEASAKAEAIYRERCTGVTGPLNLARCIWAPAVLFMGDIPEATAALDEWLEDARARDDLEAQGQLGVYRSWHMLAKGDVAAVRAGIESTLARWRPGQRETAGMTAIHALAVSEFYVRAGPQVLAHVRDLYQPFFRSFMSRVQLYRVIVMGYCANLELAIAAQGYQQKRRLARAAAIAARLEREGVRYADAASHIARAGIAQVRGDARAVVAHLTRACADFEADRQMLQAACARLRLGRALGGAEGASLCARAEQDMKARGVATPERFVAVYAPGYPD